MFKRIGIITIIGILLIIAVGIIYIFSSPILFGFLFLFLIIGFLIGISLVVVDFIYTQRRNGEKIFDPRLFIFFKIITIGFIALVINALLLMAYLGPTAGLFTGFVCFIFYIPGILVGVCIFLILLRTPAAKYVKSKKIRYFYILFAIVIIVVPILVGWPLLSPTYMDKQPIQQLHLSSDGTRLLSISGGEFLALENSPFQRPVYDYIIWNTISGEIIWNKTTSNYFDATISPDGKYFLNFENKTIISIVSGVTLVPISGTYFDWTVNGKYFVTAQDNQIIIWNATNFTKIKTIPINESIRKIALSPDSSKLAVEIHEETQNSLRVIDIHTGNSTYLYNYSEYSVFNIQYVSWSNDGKKIQIVKREFTPDNSYDLSEHYKLIIWDIPNKYIFYNISFNFDIGKMAMNRLVAAVFGKYIIYDYEKSELIFYNLTDIETVVDTNQNFLTAFDLSSDYSIIAIGEKGIIEIRNASTGLLNKTLHTPVYEIERPIPGFESAIFFFAIALILFWKHRNKSK